MDLISTAKHTFTTMLGESTSNPLQSDIPLDATRFLTAQHREVDALFAQYDDTGDKAYRTKERLFSRIAEKLLLHTKLEEEVFYPAMKHFNAAMILEAFEEHALVKDMLAKIEELAADDETFEAKITVLRELVHHHVREEEGLIFPEAREQMSEESLLVLGREMRSLADKAIKKPARKSRKAAATDEHH